ncbi:MAG: hypothetical protein CL752_00900 [Chloroflexi bacterium]|nr:hypothetical protein [Chloroflexota bacterium]MBG93347.1 hypothetical protein [Chloroflexota bacterium]MCH2524503.1 hypothetical protein [Dehalococcoidia bacterium]
MHDTTWFEIQGIPSVFIASTEFVDAATAQASMLGLPELNRVFVPHPIQDATDSEMEQKAEEVFEKLLNTLIA